jgi:hypothetical protein
VCGLAERLRERDRYTMRWKPRRWSIRKRNTVDLALDAYVSWRQECRAVRTAYLAWRHARAAEAAVAFDAYEAALDREERAAEVYAELMSRVGHLAEMGLARQLANLPSVLGA